jgi:hypothetical protein
MRNRRSDPSEPRADPEDGALFQIYHEVMYRVTDRVEEVLNISCLSALTQGPDISKATLLEIYAEVLDGSLRVFAPFGLPRALLQ